MKKILSIITVFLSISTLCACLNNEMESNEPTDLKEVSASDENKTWTEEAVIALFQDGKKNTDYEVTDCALTTDFAYDRVGVVQFTDENGNPCNFAFVDKEGFYQQVGIEAIIADNSSLTYIGDGKVTLTLVQKESGTIYDCTISFSADGDNIMFKIEDSL